MKLLVIVMLSVGLFSCLEKIEALLKTDTEKNEQALVVNDEHQNVYEEQAPVETPKKPVVETVIRKCVIDGKVTFTDQPCPGESEEAFQLSETNTMEKQTYQFKADPSLYTSAYYSATWHEDKAGYQLALRVSKERSTPIFIYGYTDWCPYCRRLEDNYFADPQVIDKLNRFVKVRINPEHSEADKQLFQSLGGKGYPALFVQHVNSEPKKLAYVRTKDSDDKKATPVSEFANRLQQQLDNSKQKS